jgi:hypothetical protein
MPPFPPNPETWPNPEEEAKAKAAQAEAAAAAGASPDAQAAATAAAQASAAAAAGDLAPREDHVGALAGDAAPTQELPPVTHNEPILTGGVSGPAVERLCRLLAAAGYATNTVVKGENPHAILDNSVMSDVHRFWADHDIHEPKDLFEGRDVAAADEEGKWIGPHTWQALIDNARQLAGV